MNSLIIEKFNSLVKQIQAELLNAHVENDVKEMTLHKYRLQAVKNALNSIKKLDFEITDDSDVKGVSGIGERTRQRIKEILTTGNLSELKNKYDKKKQEKIDSIQELEQVIGIGSSTAKKLVTKNDIKSIKELKKAIKDKKITVNNQILLGLKYYGIVQGSIPRSEILDMEKYLIKQAYRIDPKLEIMICGSFRRGKKTSGDIDVLIYHSHAKTMKEILNPEKFGIKSYLENLVDSLTNEKFLLDHMTDKNYKYKYMGFCKYKSYPVRRIDIRYIPYNSLATAMLYFTGPYELNTIMRNSAKKRGMLLSEYGLYYIDGDVRKPIKIISEADVFKELGMKYLTPEERETFSVGDVKLVKT